MLTFALSAIFYGLIIDAGTLGAGGFVYTLGLMWSPGVAALITRLLTQRNLRGLGWGPGKPRFLLIAYFLPVAVALPVYALAWATGLGELALSPWVETLEGNMGRELGVAGALGLAATIGVLASLISATGEELGWRGLLVPELAGRMSFSRVVLISGAVWSIYHYPILIFADYNSGTPVIYSLVMFTLMVLGASSVFAWLRLASGSVWPAALLHATHNLFIQGVSDGVTVATSATPWWTTEFGAGLAMAYGLAGGLAWRHMRPERELVA
jgi:membrane protease YdiL (CAAX protease family)